MMRRGGGRRGRHQLQHQLQSEENWTLQPLHDQNHPQNQQHEHEEESSPSTSSPNPQPPAPISARTPKSARNRRNSRWVSRNKGVHVVKPQFVEKSEVGPSSSCPEGCEIEEGGESSGGVVRPSSSSNCKDNNNLEEEVKEDLEVQGIEGSDSKEDVDEIGSVLKELVFGGDEPELDEDVLAINDQLQEDELLAMESIYGENLAILEKQNGLRSFQIYVHVEALRELTVSTKLNLSKDLETHTDDTIWRELPGQEVIYQWTEWLHTSPLSYLGFDEEIILGPYGVPKTGDRRAISGCISPDADIPSLKSYNDVQRHEDFRKNLHECCFCFSEYAGTDFIRLPCQHFFCCKCMKTYSDMHIKEGTVNKLLCPDTKCGGMIPPGLLRRLLGDEEFARWESLLLQKTLESMSDVVYCPRCETACIEDGDAYAQCSKCFFSFCTLCSDRRHVGSPCMAPLTKLHILQERQNSTGLTADQRRRVKQMIDELLSVKEILSNAKQCPSCKMAISKTEGCNKMSCRNCGAYFCYRCSKEIKGYDHFHDGGCELFPEGELNDYQRAILELHQAGGAIPAVHFVLHWYPCPNCGNFVGKVGYDNYLLCGVCNHHHCYQCKRIVRQRKQHFGHNGCKRHTED